MLVCSVSYSNSQDLLGSAPSLLWTAPSLSMVDLSNQSAVVASDVRFESKLTIANVNFSYHGEYDCIASDNRTVILISNSAMVHVGK